MKNTVVWVWFILGILALRSPAIYSQTSPDSLAIFSATLHGIEGINKVAYWENKLLKVKDSIALDAWKTAWEQDMQEQGWAEFSIERFAFQGNHLEVHVHQGPQYWVRSLEIPGLAPGYRLKLGIDREIKRGMPLNWARLASRLGEPLRQFQNEGYPFASMKREAVSYSATSPSEMGVELQYQFDTGPLIILDTVLINGGIRERAAFVHHLLKISPGQVFRQDRLDAIPRLLSNTPYFSLKEEPKIVFTPYQTAQVRLELAPQKSGRFDVLLGLLPPSGDNAKFEFTGTADILLISPFRYGEKVAISYQKLLGASQRLDMEVEFPFLFQLPFSIEAGMNLLKQEEDFLNLDARLGGMYPFSPDFEGGFSYKVRSSRILDTESSIVDTLSNPISADGNHQLLSAELRFNNLDYRFNPTQGWALQVFAGVGRNRIRRNPGLPEELYEGISLDQTSSEWGWTIEKYLTVFPRQVLRLANQSYSLVQDTYFQTNQQRLGGARSIRGFNENQFFSDQYTFFSTEYRLLLERDSYIFVFADYAWLNDRVRTLQRRPWGYGLGMNYGTRAGILSLSYALGRDGSNVLSAGRGKVHIGFISRF